MGRNSFTRSQCREYSIASISIFMLAFADDIVLIAPGVSQLQKLISVFALFCKNNDLVINTKKTEVMLTRCTGALYVNKVQLQECQVFRYLGIEIKSTGRSTTHIFYTRLKQAKVALLRIKNNAQLLGLNNCRVRLQMSRALVVSVLLYGAPIFTCLSDRGMTFQPSSAAFKAAEEFIRECLRWALRVKGDVRSSLLHVVGNSESVQLLCHKQCWRFFVGLESHPRAATDIVRTIQQNGTVPPEHWGTNTIRWWPHVAAQYPQVPHTQPLYKAYRAAVMADLARSTRVGRTGLSALLSDIVQYSFAGE